MKIDINEFVQKLYQEAKSEDIYITNMFSMWLNKIKFSVSSETYKFNKSHSTRLLNYFNEHNIIYISQLTNQTIYDYITFKQANNCKNSYINKHILIIKQVLNYLVDEKLINENPITVHKLPEKQPNIEIIDEKDLIRIIDYSNSNFNTSKRLLIYLLLETGIRRREISLIKRCNINLEDNYIFLEDTKNKKPGYIYFSNTTKELLKIELENNPDYTYLFTSSNNPNEPISVNSLQTIIQRLKNTLGLKHLHMHMFRHTFANSILKNTNNLEITRKLLRHQTFEMTKRYLHINEKELKENSILNNPLTHLYKDE